MNVGTILLTGLYILMFYYTLFWLLGLIDSREEPRRRMRKTPGVTVVVPVFNEEKHLERSVMSVLNLDYPKDRIRIVIVDDGSKDRTLEVARRIKREHHDRDILVISARHRGKWNALNIGLRSAKGEFFSCLDADSFVRPNSLKKALPHFYDESVAVVLPLLKIHRPRSFMQKVQWCEYLVNMFYKKLISMLNCIHVAPGPFSIYRKDVLKSVGGFRPAHSTEDLEIVLRLQEKHYRTVQISDSEVYTVGPESVKEVYRQRYRWFRGSLLNFWDYRRILFNPRYGHFGVFQAPFVFFSGFIAVILVSLIVYYEFLKPLWTGISNLILVRFDLATLFSNLKIGMNPLDFNYYQILIMVSFLALSVLVVSLSQRYNKERIWKRNNRLPLIAFLFGYYIMLAFFWVRLFADLLLRKRDRHKW